MIEREYPLVNTWGGGSYVARVTGKADREYGFAREFVRGVPDKANGLLRYTLAELGGPGWAVMRDRRRVTVLVELHELSYLDHGELDTRDVLTVVRAGGLWDGSKCSGELSDDDGTGTEHRRPRAILGAVCAGCVDLARRREEETEDRERIEAATAAAPDMEPF